MHWKRYLKGKTGYIEMICYTQTSQQKVPSYNIYSSRKFCLDPKWKNGWSLNLAVNRRKNPSSLGGEPDTVEGVAEPEIEPSVKFPLGNTCAGPRTLVIDGNTVNRQSRQSAKLFLQSSELGLPQPLTRRRVCHPPPPLVPGGGAHSLAREGVGESQFQRGDIHCGTLYIYVLYG